MGGGGAWGYEMVTLNLDQCLQFGGTIILTNLLCLRLRGYSS